MFTIVSCADNHSSENEKTTETNALTEASAAEAAAKEKKEYDYVHGKNNRSAVFSGCKARLRQIYAL